MENNGIYKVGTRGLSLLLALLMLISCVNVTAFAGADDGQAQATGAGGTPESEANDASLQAQNGDDRASGGSGDMTWAGIQALLNQDENLVLTNDVAAESGDSPLQISESGASIDLNGYTLDGSQLASDYVIISSGGTLVIKDSSASHTGAVRGGQKGNISLDNPASCRLLGGTLEHESAGVRLGYNTHLYLSGRPEARGVIVMDKTSHVDVEGQLRTAFRLSPDPSVLPSSYGSTAPISDGSVTGSAVDLFEVWTYDAATGAISRNEDYSCVRDAENRLAIAKNYTVSFVPDGGTGSMSGKAKPGTEYILPACVFAPPERKAFSGWLVGEDPALKKPFDRITVNGDVTVTAVWRDAAPHTLSIAAAAGGAVEAYVPAGQGAQTKLSSGSTVAPGVQVTLKITPASGYLLNELKVQGGSVSLSRDCRWFAGSGGVPYTETVFTMPEQNVTITPAFGAIANGLYLDLPASNLSVTIPPEVKSLQIRPGSMTRRTVKLSFNGPGGEGMNLTGSVVSSVTGNYLKVLGETYGSAGKTEVSAFTLSGSLDLNFRYTAGSFTEFNLTLTLGDFDTISFDPNGGTGSMKSVKLPAGSSYTLPACGFTHPDGYDFAGWDAVGEVKNPGDTITISGSLTLTAMWSIGWNSLQSIISSATAEKTIVLPNDVEAPDGASALSVPSGKTIVIDLNGHSVSRALQTARENGMVFSVQGNLTIRDSVGTGTVTGGNNNGNGGAVLVTGSGRLTLAGGSIAVNSGNNGGGVYVDGEHAEFILTGGSVSGNTAVSHGGGVYVVGAGTFDARGGSITNNLAGTAGGGAYVAGTGAESGSLLVSGNPVIQGNEKGTGNESSDVGLDSGLKISIVGALSGGASIGVDAESGQVASVTTTASIDDPSAFFVSNRGSVVFLNARNYVCFENEHTATDLSWEWTGYSAATLTMKCGTCGKVLWTEPAEITGPVFVQSASAETKGTLKFTALAAHSGQSYTAERSSVELTPVLVPSVAPGVDASGRYTLGTQAYYRINYEGNTYLFAPSADNPNQVGDLMDHTQPLSYFVFDDGNGTLDFFTITSYTGPLADGTVIELPKTYQGKPCTVIGDGVNPFYNAANGQNVSIRSTEKIETIAAKAFLGLSNLTAFTGSTAKLTAIGTGAFQNSGVTLLTLDAEKPVTIADSAFSGSVAVSAKHASGLKGLTGQYSVTLTDHEYNVVHDQTNWGEDSQPTTIQIRCIKDCGTEQCGDSHTLPATVTHPDTTKTIATAEYEGKTYTDEKDSYQIVLKPGLGSGTDVVISTSRSETLPSTVAGFTAPAGAVLKRWASGSQPYSPGTEITPTGNMVLTAVWESTWAEVNAALTGGTDVTLLNDIRAGSGDSALTVPAGQSVTLDMNGFTIDRALNTAADGGCALNVAGTLYLKNGVVKGGNNSGDGGALSVSGSLTMEGVTLKDNQARNGGGIYLAAGGSSTLFGSVVITNNHVGQAGGGVFFNDSTQFNLDGDIRIHDNYGNSGSLFDNLNASGSASLKNVFNVGAGGLATGSLIGASGEVLTAIIAAAGVTVSTVGIIRLIRDSEKTDVSQKAKCSSCEHGEYDVTWKWNEDYGSATATAICKNCHGVVIKTIPSTAALDESTQNWKYTVSAFGNTDTKETEPYTVTLQSGLADIQTTLRDAEGQEAAALLEKLPDTAADVVVKIAHRQGQPGTYTLPDNPWTALAGFWAFGGWKLGSEVFFADKVVPINGNTVFNSDWQCEVTYDPADPNDADPQPTDGEKQTFKLGFGATHELRSCNWTRDSHDFESWKLNMDGVIVDRKLPGAPVIVYASTLVTANWDSKWGTLNKQLQAVHVQPIQLREDLTAMSKDYALTVPTERTFTLDLHGNVLDRAMGGKPASLYGSALHVNGQLTLADTGVDISSEENSPGTVSGGKAVSGGGVWLETGSVTMTGGVIRGNKSLAEGGGAYINAGSTFYMEKRAETDKAVCEISGNTSSANGGGVFVANTGTLNLGKDSKLSGNTAEGSGGGAFISGAVTVSGNGTIDGNTAKVDGGGAFIAQSGSLTLNGNEGIDKPLMISGNSAPGNGAGVFVGGTLRVAGTVNISGNAIGDGSEDGSSSGDSAEEEEGTTECNVYLPDGKRIVIAGALTQTPAQPSSDSENGGEDSQPVQNGDDAEAAAPQGTYIGVTVQTPPSEENPAPVVITDGLRGKGTAENFGSDERGYVIAINEGSGEAMLCLPTIVKFEKGFEDSAAAEDPENNPMPDWTVGRGETFELPDCAFTRPGFCFVSWQLGDDEAARYASGAMILAEGAEMTLTAVWEAAPFISANMLVLNGTLELEYHVKMPDNVSAKGMTFQIPNQLDQYTPIESARQDRDTGCLIFVCYVNAYQMADPITALFTYTAEDGTEKTLKDENYSVMKYLDSVAADENSDGETRALVNAIRNYGHDIQPYLNRLGTASYATEMPGADTVVNVEQAKTGSQAKAAEHEKNTFINNTLISRVRIRLNVNTGTDLVFELQPADSVSRTVTALINDEDCPVENTDYGMYRVAKKDIAANNLAVPFRFTVSVGNQTAFTVTASVMDYISMVLAQSEAEDEKLALAALYEYWAAASAYASN